MRIVLRLRLKGAVMVGELRAVIDNQWFDSDGIGMCEGYRGQLLEE